MCPALSTSRFRVLDRAGFENSISNGSYGLAGLPKRPSRDFGQEEAAAQAAHPSGSQVLNERAVAVIQRVSDKLKGQDFGQQPGGGGRSRRPEQLDVPEQVQKLFDQATATSNLCQCYIGWCPFW